MTRNAQSSAICDVPQFFALFGLFYSFDLVFFYDFVEWFDVIDMENNFLTFLAFSFTHHASPVITLENCLSPLLVEIE